MAERDRDETIVEDPRWYVVHTYSGYENKVKEDLEKTVAKRGLSDAILEIKYPTEEVTEIKDGKRHTVTRKVFPGYVMIKMVMNNDLWYIVRNTRGVTGFVGLGSKPTPLTDTEVTAMGVERLPIELDVVAGDHVEIISGPFENFPAVVEQLDPERQVVRVKVFMFGRETSLDLEYVQIKRVV
ncbi:MAG: transcription termination/antitermination protein NusG [Clostridia bacterium]